MIITLLGIYSLQINFLFSRCRTSVCQASREVHAGMRQGSERQEINWKTDSGSRIR